MIPNLRKNDQATWSFAGKKVVVPELKNQQRPEFFVVRRFVIEMLVDQAADEFCVEETLIIEPLFVKHLFHQWPQASAKR